MNKRGFLSLAFLAACSNGAFAADLDHAKTLIDANCIKCHGTEVYTRADRKVTSLPGLERQVRRCDAMLSLRLFDEDIADISAYLNHHYYKFEP